MASVSLRNVKKIYSDIPATAKSKRGKNSRRGEDGLENRPNLQIIEGIGVVAVQQFNLEIADKEFVVLVGPSGCGKSTTLRMVAGLEEITEGELYIGDMLMNDVAPKDRDIAMVFQNYALYPHMTVYENMAFSLKLRHAPKDEIDRKVKGAAKILGITEYLNRKPKALSGGQRQRVAIGRAIVREPKVFLMDEPLSNLDAKLRNQMRAEIIKLRQRLNTTFIYVTHDQTEAMTLGDRIVIMRDGYIQQIGAPQEVFAHPSNLFVAGFIGTPKMNFFDAKLCRDGGLWSVRVGDAQISLPAETAGRLEEKGAQAGNITLGIRPEHIVLCEDDSPQGIRGKVDVFEMMGSSVHVHADVSGKHVVIVLPTMDLPKRLQGNPTCGTEFSFTFSGSFVHLFNKETENNMA